MPDTSTMPEDELLRRWRLVLGGDESDGTDCPPLRQGAENGSLPSGSLRRRTLGRLGRFLAADRPLAGATFAPTSPRQSYR